MVSVGLMARFFKQRSLPRLYAAVENRVDGVRFKTEQGGEPECEGQCQAGQVSFGFLTQEFATDHMARRPRNLEGDDKAMRRRERWVRALRCALRAFGRRTSRMAANRY
jgi:hypothetical protein